MVKSKGVGDTQSQNQRGEGVKVAKSCCLPSLPSSDGAKGRLKRATSCWQQLPTTVLLQGPHKAVVDISEPGWDQPVVLLERPRVRFHGYVRVFRQVDSARGPSAGGGGS